MEHFTRRITDNDENSILSNDSCSSNNLDLDPKSKDTDEIDIEALLNRPRSYGYRRTKAFEQAPEFTQRLEPFLEVEAGTSVVFVCQYKAFPKPTIKWYRDDEEITPDHPYYRAEENRDAGIASLILTDVTGQDEGAFKCKAENQEGVASTTGYLSVTGDNSSKTLSAQQKKSTNSPTSPCVSSAPHLMTILEQKSLEEREGEAQNKMPPSPLQNYIEIVQKTKTWPMAKMGYNPEDFLPKESVDDDNEDAQSSGSDTSVDSQPDTPVTINLPDAATDDHSIPNGVLVEPSHNTNLLHPDDVNDDDSVHSFDSRESDELEDENHKPVCTVSVQIRSCDSVSRLTKIRQAERHRLSLTLSEDTENSDISDNLSDVDHDEKADDDKIPEEMTPLVDTLSDEVTPIVQNGLVDANIHNDSGRNVLQEQDTLLNDEETISPQQVQNEECASNIHYENDFSESQTYLNGPVTDIQESNDSVQELDTTYRNKLSKLPSGNSSKKSIMHQTSKERKAILKKQKSLVEMSIEWLFKKITGKVGEQLDLPWVYYFAFTVLCACFAAAIKLNPFYMILIVAVLSFISFRFLPCVEVLEEDELEDTEETSSS